MEKILDFRGGVVYYIEIQMSVFYRLLSVKQNVVFKRGK